MRENSNETPPITLLASIFLLSAAVIAHEIVLARLFSITQWHHFAYMVISVALLGFGASGTLMSLCRKLILANYRAVYLVSAALYATAVVLSFIATQRVPFDPFLIVWDKRQYVYLLGYCATLFVPFFLAAICIGSTYIKYAGKVGKVYFANMAGSGAGSVCILISMYCVRAESLLPLVSATAVCAVVVSMLPRRKLAAVAVAAVSIGLLALTHARGGLELRISQFKALPALMDLPDARIVAQRSSALGRIDVVSSPAIREAPGMSLACTYEIPPQTALVVDADSVSAVTDFDGDVSRLAYLDWLTSSAVYHAVRAGGGGERTVLVVGAGGGADILAARYVGMDRVDALELDRSVIHLMRHELRDLSCDLYDSPGVKVLNAEGRAFFDSTNELYNVVQISLLDSFSASAAGVLALNESYLYTVEALRSYIAHLKPGGILSVTRWLKMPPRDNVKLFATAVEALNSSGALDPGGHIVQLRGWKTCTTLIKRDPFNGAELEAITKFCEERSFDLCYFPGIQPEVVNEYNVLERPYFYEAATALLSPQKENFYRSSLFNVIPATDDRPYYFHFFKWSSLPELRRMLSAQWIPFVEWGYVILVATLIIALPLSGVLVLLPLLWLHRPAGRKVGFPRVVAYFLAIGAGYMFIEILFIQKLTRIMPHPIIALGMTLTIFLLGSGLGGLSSSRLAGRFKRPVWIAFACITAALVTYVLVFDVILAGSQLFSPNVRRVVAGATVFVLAFFMGIPFPTGLRRLASLSPELLPWAWGINGCASVVGPILATCLSISLGFRIVMAVSAGLYLVAAFTLPKCTEDET
jgi:hypothetical protein